MRKYCWKFSGNLLIVQIVNEENQWFHKAYSQYLLDHKNPSYLKLAASYMLVIALTTMYKAY